MRTTNPTRRDFLRTGAAAGAGLILGSSGLARAGCAPLCSAKNLIIAWANGGWDPTYALEIKPGLATVDAPPGQVKPYGNIPIWVNDTRPGVQRFFDAWGSITSVINGINVPSLAHPGCRQRMLTGYRELGYADFGAISAHELSPELPIPYLVLGDAGFVGPLGASVGRVGTTNQLKTLLDTTDAYDPLPNATYTRVVPTEAEAQLVRNYVVARAERERATRGARGYNRARVEDFLSSLSRSDVLVAKKEFMKGSRKKLTLLNQVEVAVDALEQGLSRAVMIDGRYRWDSHANIDDQDMFFSDIFDGLDALAASLASRPGSRSGWSLLDETVIVVMSEMGRTPLLNDTNGKDHWPVTSAVVFGAGVRGGALCGATDDLMLALEVDLKTGEAGMGAEALYPEQVLAGILELVGVDPQAYYPGVTALRGFHA